jgi:NADPH:quinone reductase-like Zn-dependent oxidoreductase
MAETAKIVRFHKAGGPEVLQVEELPIPEPSVGEVRLRVKVIGLNRAEVMFRNNQYLYQPSFPSKLGYEAAGVVEAVGPGVDTTLVGKAMSSVPAFAANACRRRQHLDAIHHRIWSVGTSRLSYKR